MRRSLIFIALLACRCATAQYAGYTIVQNPALFEQQFANATRNLQTIQCNFIQEKHLAMLSDEIVSTGKFWYKREGKVRMEFLKPSYYLLIMNGTDIKTKDAQKENKISARSNKMFAEVNKMMVACVQGTALNDKAYTSRVYSSPQSYLIELVPVAKNIRDIFRTINLTVAKSTLTVVQIDLIEVSGDHTLIKLLHEQLNGNIPDAIFSVN